MSILTRLRTAVLHATLLAWLLAVVLPLAWVFMNSLRSSQEIFENPFGLPWLIAGSPHADNPAVPAPWDAARSNFASAWVKSHFSSFFFNSVIVTGASLAGVLTLSAMASYVLARFPFRGSRLLFLYFISGMMIPAQLVLVPLFFQFTEMSRFLTRFTVPFGYEVQLHDSLFGLTVLYIALSLPFTILVLTGFFKSLPGALREAAIMDGAGEYRVFWHVMLPLGKPGIVTAAIFNFLGLWNEYLFALVFVNASAKKTLPLGLASVSIQAQYKNDFGLMFAGLVIVMLPTLLVYMLLQRQLTRGITIGALKG
ncbi:MAG TPA: carbohydrate ABC transporter permease [Candidatus Hydrogenedentes bacterium]|nr:carbohydrate ABC transporter permease [Candidatus Hydrogenedentota bacterium]HPC15526.1 carbohydrate ABC transporter permease [Candidatus Hydrogenedentota bacterium]HRT20197.1 carbohydrate ABC transporter permease [Candidatus Hydrogenedentota bacterium]HRT64259.1 carbohydrate ABC transporter permease [Candidatus Hydrogenedentota bacterium]